MKMVFEIFFEINFKNLKIFTPSMSFTSATYDNKTFSV